jgi:hypothetical protein
MFHGHSKGVNVRYHPDLIQSLLVMIFQVFLRKRYMKPYRSCEGTRIREELVPVCPPFPPATIRRLHIRSVIARPATYLY